MKHPSLLRYKNKKTQGDISKQHINSTNGPALQEGKSHVKVCLTDPITHRRNIFDTLRSG